jgi:hypothetical protein
VPDLSPDDPCANISQSYVPSNVTRQANLPPTDFTLIAVAPWINPECTISYLLSAQLDPIRAFIFYLPDNATTQPPSPTSDVWDLGDSDHWKKSNQYPVYAIPGAVGAEVVRQLSLYSGNMTDVPNGHLITQLPDIDVRDYVRVYGEISVSVAALTPPIWVLLLIVVGILISLIAITSTTMHLVLQSRRKSLERRVANGEVNLEALGIKRLTVPQDIIDQLPTFTYSEEDHKLAFSAPPMKTPTTATALDYTLNSSNNRPPESQEYLSDVEYLMGDAESGIDWRLAHKYLPYSQPDCPICLDDYKSNITRVSELPCGHIFHPVCIGYFLSNNSSLCPICQVSILPHGYCPPKITLAMVNRERNIRQLRSRVLINDDQGLSNRSDGLRNLKDIKWLFQRFFVSSRDAGQNMRDSENDMLEVIDEMDADIEFERPGAILGDVVSGDVDRVLGIQETAQQRIRELARNPFGDRADSRGHRCILQFLQNSPTCHILFN